MIYIKYLLDKNLGIGHIGLIIPFIALSELVIAILFPIIISNMLEINMSNNFLMNIDITFLYFVIISSYLLRILLMKKAYALIQNSRTLLSSRYLDKLMASDYEFLRNYDLSKINTVGIHTVDLITTNLVTPLFNLVSGIFLIVVFSSYLIAEYTLQYFISLIIFVPIVSLLAIVLKRKQKIHSRFIRESIFKRESVLKTISENIISVLFYAKRNEVLSAFKINVDTLSDRAHKVSFLSFIVRPFIEIILLTIVLMLILTDFDVLENAEFLIIFSFILIRAIPPLSLMVTSMGLLKIGIDNYDVYKRELSKLVEPKENIESAEIILHDTDELFVYGSKWLFSDIVFESGQSTIIKGDSGVGKSTLFYKVLKLLPLSQEERLSVNSSQSNYLEHCFFIPQNGLLIQDTFKSTLHYYNISTYSTEELNYLVKEFDLNISNILNYDLGYYGSRLSGGQKQKLSIIVALLSDKKIFFMDESFSAIEPACARKIIIEISKRKKSFLGIFHSNEFDDLVENIVHIKLK